MEVKFVNKSLQCLRPFYSQVHSQEQTQEVRLPDAYPDIGKVLGCWGQVMIRGKEWRSNYMGANGGVTAWVLYAPEDGTQPRVIDVWVPFQWRWDFPESADDGAMIIHPVLTNLDGRGISARKIMVRAAVDIFAQAMGKQNAEIPTVGEVPGDVQLLTRSYPVELPAEAGEKQVQLEEVLLSSGNDQPHKLISYELLPVILEQKVLGNRLVFRGQAAVRMMYMTEDGEIKQWEGEAPFSQYTELDRDYSPNATAWVLPVVTAMELEIGEDSRIQMRAGIAAQYTVIDREILDVVEDAFSPKRDVVTKNEDIELPVLLDAVVLDMQAEGSVQGDYDRIVSTTLLSEYPALSMGENGTQISMEGQFQTFGLDTEGQMIPDSARFMCAEDFPSASENHVLLWPGIPMQPDVLPNGEGMTIRSRYPIAVQVYSGQTIPVVTELELGEYREADPNRPSIILRRAGDEGLWAIAKGYGTTVAAIQEANQLTGEPENGQMLLIPIC